MRPGDDDADRNSRDNRWLVPTPEDYSSPRGALTTAVIVSVALIVGLAVILCLL